MCEARKLCAIVLILMLIFDNSKWNYRFWKNDTTLTRERDGWHRTSQTTKTNLYEFDFLNLLRLCVVVRLDISPKTARVDVRSAKTVRDCAKFGVNFRQFLRNYRFWKHDTTLTRERDGWHRTSQTTKTNLYELDFQKFTLFVCSHNGCSHRPKPPFVLGVPKTHYIRLHIYLLISVLTKKVSLWITREGELLPHKFLTKKRTLTSPLN